MEVKNGICPCCGSDLWEGWETHSTHCAFRQVVERGLRVEELEGVLRAIRGECTDAMAHGEEGDTLLQAVLTVYQMAWAALEVRHGKRE